MFLNDWAESGIEGLKRDFAIDDATLAGVDILLASYTYENYEGNAFVLFRKDGKLYEVNGSHCSCYGLEGQWEPEETTAQALRYRLEKGAYWFEGFEDELRHVLSTLG